MFRNFSSTTTRRSPVARRLRAVATVALRALLADCARFPSNEPLTAYDPNYGYRLSAKSGNDFDSTGFLLVTTFSGGGTRAAARLLLSSSPEYQRLVRSLAALP